MPFSRSFRWRALALAGTLVLAACSSSGQHAGTSASSTSAAGTTATTAAGTQPGTQPGSTAGGTTAAPSTVVSTEAPTTVAGPPVFPLTGLPAPDSAAAERPAAVVKVGNYDAYPQRGTSKADMVYEEIINANISRFAMVFQSQAAVEVGPIRSGRRQDVNLFGSLNKPIFAWAGGNATVTQEIHNSDLVDLSQFRCQGSCYRSTDAAAPFNLMFNVQKIFALDLPGGVCPQQFTYLPSGTTAAGVASPGLTLNMDSYRIDWTWNASTGNYLRNQNGRADRDRDGTQIAFTNVVVLAMTYLPGISGSPDAQSVGKGEAFVFTGGHYIHGTWTRSDRLKPFTLKDDTGNVIALTPGRTFIELPRPGNTQPKN
jgi:hypothetical protein